MARKIIERLSSEGETIFDPMVGSGSTGIAALRAGRSFVGSDVDPMALLLSRVSTTCYDAKNATARLNAILDRARRRMARSLRVVDVREHFDEEAQDFLKYWFPPRSQKQLFALASEMTAMPKGKYRDLAWITLSNLIIAKSAGVSYALDISRSRPHKVEEKVIPDGFDAWQRRSKTIINRLPFRGDRRPNASARITRADARNVQLDSDSVELVVTSPPYINAIDYMRTHKFSLIWMGHHLSVLREVRAGMVGTERGMYSADSLPTGLESAIVESITDGSRLGLVRRYLSDMRRVLLEIHRVLKPSGVAIIALGPSIISRDSVDAGDVIGGLAEVVGFESAGCTFRPYQGARRSLPPPTAVDQGNPLGLRMEGEVLLGLRKP